MPDSSLDCPQDETALRLGAGANSADLNGGGGVKVATRLETLIRDELARGRTATHRVRPAHPRRQSRDGGRPRQPAVTAAGGLGLIDTGREERAAASMTLAAASRRTVRR
jgi:hypothetical protein